MAERVVTIKLLAEATGLVQGFGKARDAVAETKARVEESARSSREAWATVGTGLSAVGVAITGIGAAALTTGIQYNTLQQTTRAALSTLLGSAQAANAQMDKLDDFARNSPFSKATFISAQQQMLAFGIEAKKVVPYLDAVQNAVAAAGGSNADIEGIVATMSKIQSSAKITAEDLNEFGGRGVNAAELIGSQMGKTGAQIREDITSGTINAGQALDALAAGMSETYAGAAENVKDTFAGSLDRVKAAWRDFSAELARPLVDPNGGGALVDLLNWTADAMRNFEKLPEPVKNTVSALTGLVGVGSLTAGVAILALPKWVAFKDALATFSPAAAGARGGMMSIVRFLGGPWGIALAAAAVSVAVFNNAMDSSKASASQMETAVKQGASALDVMRDAAAKNEQGLTTVFVDLSSQIDNLGPLLDKAADSGRGFFSSLSFNEQGMLDNVAEFGTVLQNLATNDLPRAQEEFSKFGAEAGLTRTQLETALNEMPGFKDSLIGYAEGAKLATDDSTLLGIALGEVQPQAATSAEALQEIQGAAVNTSEAVSELAKAISDFGNTQISADEAAIKFQEQIELLNERVAEGEVGLTANTEAGRQNIQSLLDMAKATGDSAAKTLEATGSQEQANGVLQIGRERLMAAAQAYGMTEAEAAAYVNQILATPEAVATAVQLNGVETAEQMLQNLTRSRQVIVDVVTTSLNETMDVLSNLGGKAYGGTIGFASGGTIPGIGGYVSGGTVFGQGGTKSDSIMVRLSRGEEVVQEPYASMYRRELKQMNRGDFVSGSQGASQVTIVREIGDVYVQHPLTGKYLLTAMDAIANQAIDTSFEQQAREGRKVGL